MSRKLAMNDVFYVKRPIDDFTLQLDVGYYRIVVPEDFVPEDEDLTFLAREDGESKEEFERRKTSLDRHQHYTFHKINPDTGEKIGEVMEHNSMVFDFRYLVTGVVEQADLPIITLWKIGRVYGQQEMK